VQLVWARGTHAYEEGLEVTDRLGGAGCDAGGSPTTRRDVGFGKEDDGRGADISMFVSTRCLGRSG
jgi:hypothetical protein